MELKVYPSKDSSNFELKVWILWGVTFIISKLWIFNPEQHWMIHIYINLIILTGYYQIQCQKKITNGSFDVRHFCQKRDDAISRSRPPEFVLDFFLILFWISQTLLPKTRRRHQQRPSTRRKNFDIDYFYDYDYPINAEEPSRKVEERH